MKQNTYGLPLLIFRDKNQRLIYFETPDSKIPPKRIIENRTKITVLFPNPLFSVAASPSVISRHARCN